MKRPVGPGLAGLTAAQVETLRRFERFLLDRALPIGAISRGDRDVLWERHILDSLRGLRCIERREAVRIADVGSGAGLPGIPIAVTVTEARVNLIEPRRLRAGVLEAAVAELGLANVRVVNATAEASGVRADVCTARALARPEESWRIAEPLLDAGGSLLVWAGASWRPSPSTSVAIEVCCPPLIDGEGPVVMMRRTGG